MKKFLITYNVRFTENGTDQTAETCTTLEVAEERMDELQTSGGGTSTWLDVNVNEKVSHTLMNF